MTAAIEFDSVTKVYRRGLGGQKCRRSPRVVHGELGEVCAFLGPNGAGKTTSISILMGFHAADVDRRGAGFEPEMCARKSKLGLLPENFAFINI